MKATIATLPFLLGCIWVAGMPVPLRAQLVPAKDGTGTVINQQGNRFDIQGGTKAGRNLFHSFEQFGIARDQTANFVVANPEIANVLARVTGGSPSQINGLLQMLGGNHPNLYLMNPAGIVFGPNARLSVPASFSATTSTAIGIGANWFNAVGTNDYAALLGTPTQFAFTLAQPGAIVNAGNLAVNPGHSLTLVGGSVINTGTLTAAGGEVTIAAVAGGTVARVSQTGSLLSLELPVAKAAVNPLPFTPASLPQLLTGGNLTGATGVTVANGVVTLTGSGVTFADQTGTAIAANTLSVAGPTGGKVQVLGDRVGLVGANINASGTNGGGTVLIGGDFQGKGTLPNAHQTYVSRDSVIAVDALQTGTGGRAIVWSNGSTQFDGTIRARGGSQFGDGGFVEVSGQQLMFQGATDTTAMHGKAGTLLLDPTNIVIADCGGMSPPAGCTNSAFVGQPSGILGQVRATDTEPTIIYETQLENLSESTNVVLEATNNITIEKLTDGGLRFQTGTSNPPGSIAFRAGGNFSMNPADQISANGRNLSIDAANVSVGRICTGCSSGGFAFPLSNIGDLSITARTGNITTGFLTSNRYSNTGTIMRGKVTLTAPKGDITVGGIDSGFGGIDITAGRFFRSTSDITLWHGFTSTATEYPSSKYSSYFTTGGISIKHGGEPVAVSPSLVTPDPANPGRGTITLQTSYGYTIKVSVPNPFVTITGAGTFDFVVIDYGSPLPIGVSGIAGAIRVVDDSNSTATTILSNRPFEGNTFKPEVSNPGGNNPGVSNPVSSNSGVNNPGVNNPGGTENSSKGSGPNPRGDLSQAEKQTVQKDITARRQSASCNQTGTTPRADLPQPTDRAANPPTKTEQTPCLVDDDEPILKIINDDVIPQLKQLK